MRARAMLCMLRLYVRFLLKPHNVHSSNLMSIVDSFQIQIHAIYHSIHLLRFTVLMLNITGGQERGLRSGTVPTHLCVGLGAACSLALDEIR